MKHTTRHIGLNLLLAAVLALSSIALGLPARTLADEPVSPAAPEVSPQHRLAAPAAASTADGGQLDPEALKQTDWFGQAVAYIEASEYHFSQREDGAWAAPNRAQNLRAVLDPDGGVSLFPRAARDGAPLAEGAPGWWQAGLRLTGYGYAGQAGAEGSSDAAAPGEPVRVAAHDNRLEYHYASGLVEWYVNDERGLEHGFTLASPPAGGPSGSLVLELAPSAGLIPRLVGPDAVEFSIAGANTTLLYTALSAGDAAGHSLPARFSLAPGGTVRIVVDDSGAVYPVAVDPVFTWPWAADPADQPGALLGISVDTAGDVNGDGYADLVLGAPGYDNGFADEGRAYVYHGSAAGPVSALNQRPDWQVDGSGHAATSFGLSVAGVGDVNQDGFDDVVVGAPFFDTATGIEGRAFLFAGSSTGLRTTAWETSPTAQAGARFGWTVSAAGDVNGDSYDDWIVGAPHYDTLAADEGVVYLYLGGTGLPALAPGWPAGPVGQAGAHLGEALAAAGDVNGDGYDDVLAGAPNVGSQFPGEGAAYLFLGSAAPDSTPDWSADPTDQLNARFGASLAGAGNVDRDTARRVGLLSEGFEGGLMPPTGWLTQSPGSSPNEWMLVNATHYPSLVYSGSFAGWVSYDDTQAQDEWLTSPTFEIPSAVLNPTLEFWAISDTLYPGATVTVYATDAAGTVLGTLWDMIADETWPTFQYRLVSRSLAAYAGQTIRLAWRYHGQGGESFGLDEISVYGYTPTPTAGHVDVVIGAPGYSGENAGEGRAYVYSGSALGLDANPYWWTDPTNQNGAEFGTSVGAIDPATGTGVLVGAPKYDSGIYWDEGRLYVFPATAASGSLAANWYCTNQAMSLADARFGQVVAAAGDTDGDGSSEIVAGGYQLGDAGYVTQEGHLFQYELSYNAYSVCSFSLAAALHPSDQGSSGFGLSASSGDFNGDGYGDVVAGAHTFDAGVTDEGRVYAFYGSPHGLMPPASETWYIDPADQDGARFGTSVAAAGDVNGDGYDDLLIGAYSFDTATDADAGAAFLYYGSPSGMTWQPAWGNSPAGQAGAQFGLSVSGAGDVNGDGHDDVIVGAPGFTGEQAEEGRAYVYHGSFFGLSGTPDWLLDPADEQDAQFGWSVSGAGDMNGDGHDDVIVGAPYKDMAGINGQGAAYIYRGSAAGLETHQWWVGYEAGQALASFGYAVSDAGDVNGDGYGDVIVGAPYADATHIDRGRAYVFHGGTDAPAGADWAASPEPQHDAQFGFAVGAAGDVDGDGYDDVIAGAYNAVGFVKDAVEVVEGRTYLFRGAPGGLYTTPAWTADPANEEGASFGAAVAGAGDVNGDGYADVIAGAPYFDRWPLPHTNEGRFYVYYGSQAGLTADASPAWVADPADGDLSGNGYVVGTAGDVNGDGFADVLVGTWDEWHVTCGVGVYVYHGSAGGLPPGSSPNWHGTGTVGNTTECFGYSAAAAGDVNGDGYDDLVSGAYAYNDNGDGLNDDGAVYIYYGSASGLAADPAVLQTDPAGPGARTRFGYSVAGAGDVDGDGYADIVVGAPSYSGGGYWEEGRLYVFYGSATGLDPAVSFDDPYNQDYAGLGSAVAAAGDVNGDGYADVIASAPGYSGLYGRTTSAILYQGSAGGLVYTALWGWYGSPTGTRQIAVGTAGDVNGDGFADVIVGVPGLSGGAGRAYVFHGSPAGPSAFDHPDWTVAPSDEAGVYGANFGWSASTAGDVNGDGFADVIIGAPWLDTAHPDEGRAYIYHGSASGLGALPEWIADPVEQDGAHFGFSVGFAGDVNGDGLADVIAGAPDCSASFDNDGRAYVFYGQPQGLAATDGLMLQPDGQDYAYLGMSVASAGDVNGDGYCDVIVGAYNYNPNIEPEGKVYVFYGSAQGLSSTPAWSTAPINNNGARLGWSVGTAGDVNGDGYADVIIGAPGYGAAGNRRGRVYVYHGSATGLSATADWMLDPASPDQTEAQWGWSVGTAGDVNGDGYADVIIGAPYYDMVSLSLADAGSVVIYYGSSTGLTPQADGPDWSGFYLEAGANYGYAVSTAGDVNRDGYSDIVIGIPNADNTSPVAANAGGALVHHGSAAGPGAHHSPDWGAFAAQADSHTGASVGTAGDVNGDGYSDVIVGAPDYDTDLGTDEGRAYVFHGSAAGLSATADWYVDPADQAGALLGHMVGTAGDVNGDGYSDVIVGARLYDTAAQADAGQAFVYHGSASGLPGTGLGSGQNMAAWRAAGAGEANAQFGYSLGSAGDVNGDGYSDVLVGAPVQDGEGTDRGAVYVYYGNGGNHPGSGPRQYRYDNSQPIGPLGLTAPIDETVGSYRLNLLARSPFGRGKVRLQWEVKRIGQPFDGTGLAIADTWTDALTGGTELHGRGTGADLGGSYKWRARLVGRDPLPWTGRWFTPSFNNGSEADFRVPLTVRQPITQPGWMTLGETPNKGNVEEQGTMDAIEATVHLDGRHPNATAHMLDRHYSLAGTGSGWRVEICLHYEDDEVGSLDEPQFRLCRWTGASWACPLPTANSSAQANLVCAAGVTAFSDWTISDNQPTAVRVVSFTAAVDPAGRSIILAWETASEIDNLGFNLYRSESGEPGTYVRLNENLIPSQAPGSPVSASYDWADRTVVPGQAYFYLLEDVDMHGGATQHGPVSASLSATRYRVYLPLVATAP